jgi:hypothetical protein
MTRPIDVEKLTQRKVTVPLVLLGGILVLGWRADGLTVDYLDDFFITKAVAEEQFEQISKQVETNTDLIVQHVGEYKLNENASRMSRIESQLYDLEFHVEQNGETELTRDRKKALTSELQRLGRVRSCIVRNQHKSEGELVENCDAIQ